MVARGYVPGCVRVPLNALVSGCKFGCERECVHFYLYV